MTTTQTDEHTAQAAAERLLAVLNFPGSGSPSTQVTPTADVDENCLYFNIGHELDVVGERGDQVTWSAVPHRTRQCWECDHKREAEESRRRVRRLLGKPNGVISVTEDVLSARIKALQLEADEFRRRAEEASADVAALVGYGIEIGFLADAPF